MVATECIYNKHAFGYRTKTYNLLRIATIVNELNKGSYNYNYPLVIWDDSSNDTHHEWCLDGDSEHQIRAFYYCKKNIYMSVNRLG